MDSIIASFWFLLPAAVANMSPVLFKWVPLLNFPVSQRLFGEHKTYRGFLFGSLMAILTVYAQRLLYAKTLSFSIVDYSQINVFLLGFLLGFGALFGDLIKSFFKRKFNVHPGHSWPPFDQIDWIIGAFLFVNVYVHPSLQLMAVSLVIFGLLHPAVNLIGFVLKIKKNKF